VSESLASDSLKVWRLVSESLASDSLKVWRLIVSLSACCRWKKSAAARNFFYKTPSFAFFASAFTIFCTFSFFLYKLVQKFLLSEEIQQGCRKSELSTIAVFFLFYGIFLVYFLLIFRGT